MSRTRKVAKEDLESLEKFFYTKNGNLYAKYPYCNRVKKDQQVGCDNGQGYLVVMCRYKLYMVHRVIFFLANGYWPKYVVDHINGDTFDNRPDNLRDCTQGENTRSYAQAHSDSVSKYRGVCKDRHGNWSAEIMCKGKRYRKAGIKTEEEAALIYNKKAMELGFSKEALNKVNLEDLV